MAEALRDHGVLTRLGGKIEHDISTNLPFPGDLGDASTEMLVHGGIADVAGQIIKSVCEGVPDIAIEGILVGTVLALITSKQLVTTGQFGKGVVFTIPWGQIGILVTIAFVASLIATVWPAQQASQIAPAVALRIAD